jgi:hypothetical protein
MLVGVAVSAVVINSVERFGVAQHAEPEQPRDHGDPLEIVAARQLGRAAFCFESGRARDWSAYRFFR